MRLQFLGATGTVTAAADALRQAIEERHGWPCSVPEYLDSVEI